MALAVGEIRPDRLLLPVQEFLPVYYSGRQAVHWKLSLLKDFLSAFKMITSNTN